VILVNISFFYNLKPNKTMKRIFYVALFSIISFSLPAQFGIGFTFGGDCYQRYTNPEDSTGTARSAGSAILNMQLGPKIWIGGSEVSFSLEGTTNIGFFAFGLKDKKGLGAVSFPIIARLNFKGLSALDKEGRFGLSIGGGIQWNRTELYGLNDDYKELGVRRSLFRTYVGEVAYGFGLSGFSAKLYVRYGRGSDNSDSFNFGIAYDFNIPQLNKIKSKNDLL
jgi:hypothetical protein